MPTHTAAEQAPITANVPVPCPNPQHIVLTAGAANVLNNIFPGDFSAAALAAPRVGLGDAHCDKFFLCTFKLDLPSKCCQITRAVLTVKMKANQPGSSVNDHSAGNDTIGIYRNGAGVVGYGEHVYSNWPFAAGQPSVKTFNLTGAELTNLNTDRRLSFVVQDDTMVQSATLELWGCCLSL